jgi:hypothetical protein
MIPFLEKYNEDIKAGNITLTFRDWNTLNVQKNKIYKAYNLGLLRILDVGFMKLVDVTIDEVRKCGYNNLQEFRIGYEEGTKRKIDFRTDSTVRVEFEYVGDDIENKKRLMGKITPMELYEVKQKILILEEKNGSPWIVKTLHSLSQNGCQLSGDLEKLLKISSDNVRQKMRKLKELNLIYSNSKKGYSITPLSLKLLKIIDNAK